MDPTYVTVHMEEDRSHWWFRGRLAVILAALRRALPPRPVRLLELGCGTGNVLAALSEFGEAVGMEAHGDLIAAARAAGLDVRVGHLPDDLGRRLLRPECARRARGDALSAGGADGRGH